MSLESQLGAHKLKFCIFLLVSEIIFLVAFAALVRYGPDSVVVPESNSSENNASSAENSETYVKKEEASEKLNSLYPMFQDVHVMIFVGFGFLMMFLKNYGLSAVSYNFLLSAFLIQYSILVGGLAKIGLASMTEESDMTIYITTETLFEADFTCAAVLITFGAVLGKLSAFQLLIMATFEVLFYKANEVVGVHFIKAADMGGSMFVHVFGAYFGLVLSRVLNRESYRDRPTEGSDYKSDMFSMIGTIFLWLYWPSFNSALATDEERVRAVVNTYIALCASCVVTFAVSSLLERDGKVTIAHVQNATLAGGVAVGTCSNMMIHPAGALAIGLVAGALSTFGFAKIQGILDSVLGVHDTCGVNNLHGMPGLLAGICGIIAAAFASNESYGDVTRVFADFEDGPTQAMRQGGALLLTLVIAAVGAVITGLVIRFTPSSHLQSQQFYNDTDFWADVDFDETKYVMTSQREQQC